MNVMEVKDHSNLIKHNSDQQVTSPYSIDRAERWQDDYEELRSVGDKLRTKQP